MLRITQNTEVNDAKRYCSTADGYFEGQELDLPLARRRCSFALAYKETSGEPPEGKHGLGMADTSD